LEIAPLQPHAFTFIFPLLSATILKGAKVRNVDHVLLAADLLMQHCSLEDSWIPRTEMCTLLLFLMETFPRLERSAHSSLLALSMQDDDQVWLTEKLIAGLMSNQNSIRLACLEALQHVQTPNVDLFDVLVWNACFDSEEEISSAAERLWDIHRTSQLERKFISKIVEMTMHANEPVRHSAGNGLRDALKLYPDQMTFLESLHAQYKVLRNPPPVLPNLL
jgi:hypothetical protein